MVHQFKYYHRSSAACINKLHAMKTADWGNTVESVQFVQSGMEVFGSGCGLADSRQPIFMSAVYSKTQLLRLLAGSVTLFVTAFHSAAQL
jgi:hypothetical protein